MKNRIFSPVTCILLFFFGIGANAGDMKITPTLTQFDEEVAQCRRLVRKYCGVVQAMMMEKEIDPIKQEKGMDLLLKARKRWDGVMNKWGGGSAPPEYASDKVFKTRLRDFANALEDMKTALAKGDVRRSFMSCSFGCGLFVTMHEQNGLHYALDALFHLRKTAKNTGAVMQTQGIDKVRPMLREMMAKRDEVLLSRAPWPDDDDRLKPYLEAVRNLSRELDELALAVESNDQNVAKRFHKRLLDHINQAYGLAL